MTAQELKDLASDYQNLARAVVDYRTAHPLATDAERDTFNRTVGDVLKTAEDLMNQSLQKAIVDVGTSVGELQEATKRAAAAVKAVDTLTKLLSIAGAAVGLGASILNPTPGAVVSALNTLVQAIQKASARPTGGLGAGSE